MRADSDFSPAVAELLDRYTPLPQIEPDWEAIRSQNVRTSQRRARRRLVPLAAALAAIALALAVVTPLGGAVRNKLGDFSAWLQGTPGEPVSEEEQRAFDQANATWGSFPGSPQLRQLADVEADGASYRLLGFRSEGSLCLRLVARGSARGSTLMCAPVSDLRNDEAPARVLVADWGVGRGTKTKQVGFDTVRSAHAQVTAGIAADGVEAIELVDDQGRHRVPTQSNAFIYVAEEPEVGQRVTKVQARLDDDRLVDIPLAVAPFGGFGGVGGGTANGEPGGPTEVERRVVGGRIGWLDRRENRGEPARDIFAGRPTPPNGEFVFGRVLTPDPSSSKRVAILETRGARAARPGDPPRDMICSYVVTRGGTGGGCNLADDLFPGGSFTFGYSTIGGGDQFATFAGMASDEVARLEAFTATGNTIPVPLADNSYLAEIAIARFPVKLVAYDSEGRVIGIEQTQRDEVTGRVVGPPIVERSVEIPEGGSATLRAHHTEDGGQCWFVRGTGALRMSTSGCTPRDWQKAPVRVGPIGATPLLAVGRARSDVLRVVFSFDNGTEANFTPDDEGYVFEPFPESLRKVRTQLTEIRGLGANGAIIDRQRVDRPPGG